MLIWILSHIFILIFGVKQNAITETDSSIPTEYYDFCLWREDGTYSLGCVSYFAVCSGGITYIMTCPPESILNEENGLCFEREYVAICVEAKNNQSIEAILNKDTYEQGTGKANEENIGIEKNANNSADINDDNNNDMDNNRGNNKKFNESDEFNTEIIDFKGIQEEENKFQNSTNEYDADEIVAEGALLKAVTKINKNNSGNELVAEIDDENGMKSAEESGNGLGEIGLGLFCFWKYNGIYSLGCISEYVLCYEEMIYIDKCPDFKVYDVETQYCRPRSMVAVCAGINPVTMELTSEKPNSETSSTNALNITSTTKLSITKNLEDSISMEFPTNESTSKQLNSETSSITNNTVSRSTTSLPTTTIVELVNTKVTLNNIETIPSTTETTSYNNTTNTLITNTTVKTPTVSSTLVTTPYSTISVKSSKMTATSIRSELSTLPWNTTEIDYSFFCLYRLDGIYSIGCFSYYISCSNGITYLMQCPEDLILSVTKQACVARIFSEACEVENNIILKQ